MHFHLTTGTSPTQDKSPSIYKASGFESFTYKASGFASFTYKASGFESFTYKASEFQQCRRHSNHALWSPQKLRNDTSSPRCKSHPDDPCQLSGRVPDSVEGSPPIICIIPANGFTTARNIIPAKSKSPKGIQIR